MKIYLNKKYILSIFLALLACILWAGNFIVARSAVGSITPIGLSFTRWAIAFLCIILFTYKDMVAYREVIFKYRYFLIAVGVINISIFSTIIYIAARHTTVINMSLILALSPLGTLFTAALIKMEKFTASKIIGALIALLGAFTVICKGDFSVIMQQNFNIGDLLILIAAVIWSFWNIVLKYKPKELDTNCFITIVILIGTLILLPFYVYEQIIYDISVWSLRDIGFYLYLGIGVSLIAWIFWEYSIANIGAVKTGLIYYTVPVFSSILAIIILNEPIYKFHYIGFLLVFLGIFVSNVSYKKKRKILSED